MAHSALHAAVQPFCVWTGGSRNFAIHLRPDVIERLGTESWMAFKRVPGRGLEIGGILLGRVETSGDSTTFWVDGFQPVESEYRSGPSYLLSELDLEQLRQKIGKQGSESIGIFRSQTRSEQLSLAEADVEVIDRCFESGDAVFLLLGPAPGMAAFFVRADGALRRVHEFALVSSLATMNPRQRRSSASIPRPPSQGAPQPPSAARQLYPVVADHVLRVPDRGEYRRQALESAFESFKARISSGKARISSGVKGVHWIAGAIVFLALAAIAFVSALPSRVGPQVLHLNVQSAGPLIRLRWNPNDPGLRGAVRAILHIQDGDEKTDRELGPSEFREGSVTYEPKNADVTFRLEVYTAEPKATGIVQVVNLAPPPAIAPAVSGALNPNPPLKNQWSPPQRPEPVLSRSFENSHSAIAETHPTSPSLRESTAPDQRDFSLPSTTPAAPKVPNPPPPSTNSAGSSQTVRSLLSPAEGRTSDTSQRRAPIAEPAPAPLPPQPSIQISMEPLSGSRVGRLVRRVPLLRRLSKDETVAPIPINQALPILKAPLVSLLRPVSIGIKIDVNESGAVTFAEVADYGDPPNFTLVNASLAAAERWTFLPARLKEAAVASQAILYFNFGP